MDLANVEIALEKIEVGLRKYIDIMDMLHKVDVSKDMGFQRRYNGFYKLRQRKPEFYKGYYEFMESNKKKDICFNETLRILYNEFGRIEISFSSKLVATINPRSPVWDEFVLKNLNLKKPNYGSPETRINKAIEIYSKIQQWYSKFLITTEAKQWIELFDSRYPNTNITDVKKIDLILWQMR